jgi:hypothetical protein
MIVITIKSRLLHNLWRPKYCSKLKIRCLCECYIFFVKQRAPQTIPERNIPERKNPERKNPNLFSGIYVIIPNVIIPKRGGKGLS